MAKQIFRELIPKNMLYDLLEQVASKTEKFYVVDLNAYKKMRFHKLHDAFLSAIIEYYHYSKRFYVERDFTYNSITNIVRQICRINNIPYTSQIRYNESKYNIDYYIYYQIE